MSTAYLYPWNAPDWDVAAANGITPDAAVSAAHETTETSETTGNTAFAYLTPDGERRVLGMNDLRAVCRDYQKGVLERERQEIIRRRKHEEWLRRRLASLPSFIRTTFSRKLEKMDRETPERAYHWLCGTFEKHVLRRVDVVNEQYEPQTPWPDMLLPLRDAFHRLPWADRKKMRHLAWLLASVMTSEFTRRFDDQYALTGDLESSVVDAYGYIASRATFLNIFIPGWRQYQGESLTPDDALRCVSRLQSQKWWLGKIRRIHECWREHLLIATGHVSKYAGAKCSDECLASWRAQRKANLEWMSAMDLENEDTGERMPLLDKVLSSIANPKIARHELTVRAAGFQATADEMGYVAMFYTLTAPSSYHSMRVKDGKRNDKYSGASPRATQKYLCNVWSRVRAAWRRKGIRTFGIRTVEPHHDGTPHWHLVLWFHPNDTEEATCIFQRYALAEDGDEPGADKYRFEAVEEDKTRGRAIGYIVKYISKNIDGYGLDGEADRETGKSLKDEARRVRAWASRWRIRQFQQIGGAPVSVWRELRRLGERELVLHPQTEVVRAAADEGDWQAYTMLQGGPFVERRDLAVFLAYNQVENANDYGDTVRKIAGVRDITMPPEDIIFTRPNTYKIVPKASKNNDKEQTEGRDAAPWSSVNNCTHRRSSGEHEGEHSDKTPPESPPQTVKKAPKSSLQTEEESASLNQIIGPLERLGFTVSRHLAKSVLAGGVVRSTDGVVAHWDTSCNRLVVTRANASPSLVASKVSEYTGRLKRALARRSL